MVTTTATNNNVPQKLSNGKYENFKEHCPRCPTGKLFLEDDTEDGVTLVCFACGFRKYPEPLPLARKQDLI